MSRLKLSVSLLLAFIALSFIVQNASVVQIRFLFWKFDISHVLLMVLMLVCGLFLGWALGSYRRLRKR